MCGKVILAYASLGLRMLMSFTLLCYTFFFTIKPARLSLCYVYIRFIREGMMSKEGPIDSNKMIF